MRGSLAAAPFCGVVPVISPKVPPRPTVGSPKLVWLNRLKYSARNCRATFKRLDHGPSDFDHRNVASVSFVYPVPNVLKAAPGVVRYIVNGWQGSGLFQTRSGDPLTVTSSSRQW
jgi:hypothetical protein